MSTRTGTQTWQQLRDHLAQTGRMQPDGTTRRAQPRLCRRCNAHVIVGLDCDLVALPAQVDPTPLTAAGEVVALAQARRTLRLTPDGGRHTLDYRDSWRITGHPAETCVVLPEHRCGEPLAGALVAPTDERPAAAADPIADPTACPF